MGDEPGIPDGRAPPVGLREREKVLGDTFVSSSRVASNEVSGEGAEQR